MANQRPRVIKRYANRKLYDTADSRYVTHSDVADFVRDGATVQIIDKDSGEDLTGVTLAQILFQQEKRRGATVPLETLKGIIQSGGEFIQRRIADPVPSMREGAEARVEAMKRTLHTAKEERVRLPEAPAEGVPEGIRDWLDNTHKAYETLQATLEDRWKLATNVLNHVDQSRKRIDALEARVQHLERLLKEKAQGEPS